jgi:protein TonB
VATIFPRSDFRDHSFAWALVFSLTLHVLIMARLPGFHFHQLVKPVTLDVTILPPPPAPPLKLEPVPEPEPVKPEPVLKPQPVPKPRPIELPKERSEPQPVASKPEPSPEPPLPAVISIAPKVEGTPPTFTAPPPEPVKPVGPTPQAIDNDRDLYSNLLTREIAKHKQYPKIAQMRGWQGTVKVELQIDNNGNLVASSINKSSGFEALDNQALVMVKKASPLPLPPESLRNRQFNILVPVTFRLE